MVAVYGFGGLRDYNGDLSFHPRLPDQLKSLRFPLNYKGRRIDIELTQKAVTYLLTKGAELTITHQEEPVILLTGKPVTMPVRPADTNHQPAVQGISVAPV